MTDTAPLLLDRPDPHRRAAKAAWRQLRDVVGEGVRVALLADDVAAPRVSVLADDPDLATALAADLDLAVAHFDEHDDTPPPVEATGDHVVVVPVPDAAGPDRRLALLRRGHARVRATGHLLLVATVVAEPGGPTATSRDAPPSLSRLLEELDLAGGNAVHVDDLRSLRWAREPLRRGVFLSVTSLAAPRGW